MPAKLPYHLKVLPAKEDRTAGYFPAHLPFFVSRSNIASTRPASVSKCHKSVKYDRPGEYSPKKDCL